MLDLKIALLGVSGQLDFFLKVEGHTSTMIVSVFIIRKF